MRIFFHVFTDDELFNDSYPMKIVDDLYYEVEGKNINESNNINDKLFAGNVTSEARKADNVDGGVLPSTVNRIDIVLKHNLVKLETTFDKSSFYEWLKAYSNKLKKHVQKKSPNRVQAFQDGMIKLGKKVLSKFDDYRFYLGKSNDTNGMVVLQFYRENSSTPVFIYFIDGLEERR